MGRDGQQCSRLFITHVSRGNQNQKLVSKRAEERQNMKSNSAGDVE